MCYLPAKSTKFIVDIFVSSCPDAFRKRCFMLIRIIMCDRDEVSFMFVAEMLRLVTPCSIFSLNSPYEVTRKLCNPSANNKRKRESGGH